MLIKYFHGSKGNIFLRFKGITVKGKTNICLNTNILPFRRQVYKMLAHSSIHD